MGKTRASYTAPVRIRNKKFGELVRITKQIVVTRKYISMLRDSVPLDLLINAPYTTSIACCVTWRRGSHNSQECMRADFMFIFYGYKTFWLY